MGHHRFPSLSSATIDSYKCPGSYQSLHGESRSCDCISPSLVYMLLEQRYIFICKFNTYDDRSRKDHRPRLESILLKKSSMKK